MAPVGPQFLIIGEFAGAEPKFAVEAGLVRLFWFHIKYGSKQQ